MSFFMRVFGGMLSETGQALQRVGLRAMDYRVLEPLPYKTIGAVLPDVRQGARFHPTSTVIGQKVIIGNRAVIGENTVIRGEEQDVIITFGAEIGKNCVITAASHRSPETNLPTQVIVGADAVVGDGCVLDSCLLEDEVTLGENCIVGAESVIGFGSVLEADTVVPPSSRIPENQIWGGNPAKFIAEKSEH